MASASELPSQSNLDKHSAITSLSQIADPKSREEYKKSIRKSKKIVYIKKNLLDPTAALSYALGVSIVHFAMFISINFVKKIDMEQAGTLSEICQYEAAKVEQVFKFFYIWHAVTFIACFYREVFTGSISKSGQFMRIVEIICLVCYLGTILKALEAVSLILVREHTEDPVAEMDPISHEEYKDLLSSENVKKSTKFLAMQCSRSDFQSFQGRTFEWIIIEISVYIFFLATLIITMAKSRFMGVGMDNSDQFEPLKMSFMIKQIIKSIDIAGQGEGAENYFVGMERVVMVEGINIKVNLTKQAFDDIKAGNQVTPENSQQWIKDCFVGNITKADLDDERARETNQLDLIQNASILYHTESILEM